MAKKTVDQLTTETIDLLFHKFSLLRECLKTSILDSFVVDPKPNEKKVCVLKQLYIDLDRV